MQIQIHPKLKDSVTIVMECKMKISLLKFYTFSIFIIITTFWVVSCSDLQEDIASPPTLNIHGTDVDNPSSPDYHGTQVAESKNGMNECKQCHASDFSGGTAGVGCNTTACHPTIDVHQAGILIPSSDDFHPKYLKNTDQSMFECKQCHGTNFTGGVASPSCANCHATIPVHVEGISSPSSENFHAKYLNNTDQSMYQCKQCHGDAYEGGTISPTCTNCHETISVHVEGIIIPTSDNFHPKYLKNNNKSMSECTQCHGDDYTGGLDSPSCANCHSSISVHQAGIVNPSSPNFHGKYITNQFNWDMRSCAECHGINYSGGYIAPTCLTCHTQTNGPEACNTCHGDFLDPSQISPPRALDGSIETTDPGVGAHNAHLYQNTLGSDVSCETCHIVPETVYAEGHIGSDGKAEITFGGIANNTGAQSQYDFSTSTCSNTYCHGNFVFNKNGSPPTYGFAYTGDSMVGNNNSVIWNKVDGSQIECGSCHGLPPTGHIAATLNQCVNCHVGIVDANGNIIDKTKHINGEPNVFGN